MSESPRPGSEKRLVLQPQPEDFEDTDALFHRKPYNMSYKHHTRLLGRLLRDKLLAAIESALDRDIYRRHSTTYIDVLKSDPEAPNYYEWHFSPEYPAFTPRPISNWAITQIKECYNAIENGAIYVVDLKNKNSRAPEERRQTQRQTQKQARRAPVDISSDSDSDEDIPNLTAADRQKRFLDNTAELSNASGLETDRLGGRRQLVSATEAAFTHYIVETTGLTVIPFKSVLTEDGSAGLPGWRWKFPSQGPFCQFPEKNAFWQWTNDQLNSGMEALAQKTLVLEPFDSDEQDNRGNIPLADRNGTSPAELRTSNPPVVLGSPEHSPVIENTGPTIQGSSQGEDPGLDDLVMQLNERARQWKELTQELKRSKQREEDLRSVNAEQTTRIDKLEKTVSDHATAVSENVPDTNLKSGMEYILGELGRIKAINKELKNTNEELKNTIKKHEDEARDNNWLRERNQVLERQLAEKTAEADSTRAALNTLAQASSHTRVPRDLRTGDGSTVAAARRISDQTSKFLQEKGGNRPSDSQQITERLSSTSASNSNQESPKRKSREGLDIESNIKRTKFGSSLINEHLF